MYLTVEKFLELASTRVIVRAMIYPEVQGFSIRFFAAAIFQENFQEYLVGIEYEYRTAPDFSAKGECFHENEEKEFVVQRFLDRWPDLHRTTDDVTVSLSVMGGMLSSAPSTDWRFLQALALSCKGVQDEVVRRKGLPVHANQQKIAAFKRLLSRMQSLLNTQNAEFGKAIDSLGAVR